MNQITSNGRAATNSNATPSTAQADLCKEPALSLLEQKFTATAPNQKWVANINYLPTQWSWFYLAVA